MIVVAVVLSWQGVRALMAWNSIERVEFDLDSARADLPSTTSTASGSSGSTSTTSPEVVVSYRAMLVLGSDERPEDVRESVFADAVILYLVPDDGSGPAIVSFPRDMLVVDPCTGEESKVNRMLTPCGDSISGPEHVALAVEDATGLPIESFALIQFGTLEAVVEAVGGIEICIPYAMREGGYDIAPAGCSVVDGEHALAFLRSRTTQVFVDGEWRFAEELGDRARIGRHQILLFALLDRLRLIRSPTQLAGLAEDFSDAVVLSDTIGLGDLVSMVWSLRDTEDSRIRTITVPGEGTTLEDGSYAVRPTATVRELLEG